MSVVFSLFATSYSTKITCIIVYLGNIWRHHRHKLYWWHCYWWCGDHGWCLSLTWWVDSFESDSEIWLVTDQLTYSKTCINWTLTSEWVLIDCCFAWCPLDTVFIAIWIKSMTLQVEERWRGLWVQFLCRSVDQSQIRRTRENIMRNWWLLKIENANCLYTRKMEGTITNLHGFSSVFFWLSERVWLVFSLKTHTDAKLVLFLSSYSRLPVAPYLYGNNFLMKVQYIWKPIWLTLPC